MTRVRLAAVALAVVAVGGPVHAGQRAVELAAGGQVRAPWRASGVAAIDATVQSGFRVAVDFAALTDAADSGGLLDLPLTGDLVVRAVVAWAGGSGTFVAGPLIDGQVGNASLTVVGDALSGRIVLNDRLFMVRRLPGSTDHVVIEIDQRTFPPEAPPREVPPTLVSAEPTIQIEGDTNGFVDLLIVYTPASRVRMGSTAAMVADLTGSVNNANLALANAGVTHRYRLVHHEEVAYVETGDSGVSLTRLSATADGYLDTVPVLRNLYKADAVSLITTDVDACGRGYLLGPSVNPSFEAFAYNVVAWQCANANLSLAHEIGHNMGLNHDRANAGTSVPAFPYAFGYAVPGVARDVMGYPCEPQPSCPRLSIYSTPLFNFPGVALVAGTATEDNARALNGTSLVVANFRQSTCVYTLSATTVAAFPGGRSGSVGVTTTTGCTWSAVSNHAFVTVTGGASATGSGTFNYVVSPNHGGARNGTITVAGQTFTITQAARAQTSDFDGDGKAEIGVFRPSTGTWYIRYTGTPTALDVVWGGASDIPVVADYDGDGKTDIAVFRPTTGTWYIRYTETPTAFDIIWGGGSDIPVPADYDGDRKADIAVFRPSTGTWYIRYTATPTAFDIVWGGGSDIPVVADYDGDGKADIAVFRPSTGTWYIRYTATPTALDVIWGGGTDIPVVADYDGDGKADIAVFRQSTGTWYIRYTATPTALDVIWGGGSDIPVSADYDGDGKADIAVFRPSTGTWYIRYTSTPTAFDVIWGGGSDIPVLKQP